MPENNQILSLEGQLCGIPLAGPESFSQQQLDYLKRALGVDETVLCNTQSNSSCTLSEAYTNFERIKIVWTYGNELTSAEFSIVPMESEFFTADVTATTNKNILFSVTNLNGNGSTANQFVIRAALWKFTNSTTLDFITGYQLFNGNVTSLTAINVRRVYGIHRIAGGN